MNHIEIVVVSYYQTIYSSWLRSSPNFENLLTFHLVISMELISSTSHKNKVKTIQIVRHTHTHTLYNVKIDRSLHEQYRLTCFVVAGDNKKWYWTESSKRKAFEKTVQKRNCLVCCGSAKIVVQVPGGANDRWKLLQTLFGCYFCVCLCLVCASIW